jgi:ribose-phosphate pyrophosphokinase
MLKIFAGTANPTLSASIAKELGQSLGEIDLGQFPDGETKIEIIDPIRGHDVFVIQPTCPAVNDNLMQLLIMLDAIKRSSPSRVTAVIPYYGYARQDRKHGPREPITAKLVADLLSVAGPDRVLFLDLHAMQIQGFFDMPADDLHADTLITDYFNEKGLTAQNATIVAVNNGGARRVRRVALLTGAKIALIESRQQAEHKVLNVVGSLQENCIIIDDILDTGNKVCAAAALLKEHGAKNVYVWATHPVLSAGVSHIQESAIDEIATTDSVPIPPNKQIPKIKVLSVAPLIAEAIRRIHNEETLAGYI